MRRDWKGSMGIKDQSAMESVGLSGYKSADFNFVDDNFFGCTRKRERFEIKESRKELEMANK